ncbi:hypothetical protein DLJ57_12485, partial [Micromonospora chalcea]
LAVGRRLRGGAPYAGARLRVAANSTRALRRRTTRHRPDELVLWVQTGSMPAEVKGRAPSYREAIRRGPS